MTIKLKPKTCNLLKGFTLLEMLVGVTILVALSSAVLIITNPLRILAGLRDAQRETNLNAINNAIVSHIMTKGEWDCQVPLPSERNPETGEPEYRVISSNDLNICSCLVPDFLSDLPVDPKTGFKGQTCSEPYDTKYAVWFDPRPGVLNLALSSPNSELKTLTTGGQPASPSSGSLADADFNNGIPDSNIEKTGTGDGASLNLKLAGASILFSYGSQNQIPWPSPEPCNGTPHPGNWLPSNGETITAGDHCVNGDFIVKAGRTVYLPAGSRVRIFAAAAVIEGTALLSGDGKGYTSSGLGEGGDGSSFDDYNTGGGGAYGGNGGAGKQGTINGSGGTAYGSLAQPTDLGSDGGEAIKARYSEVSNGGAGGGALFLNITGNLTVNGTISSNGAVGQAGQYLPAGGGSGGSIWIIARDWQGSGAIQANGGAGPTNTANWSDSRYGGGGGGGRIAVYYTAKNFIGAVTAYGGSSSGQVGAAGTIYERNNSGNDYGALRVKNNYSSIQPTLTAIADTLSFDDIELANGANLVLGANTNTTGKGNLTVTAGEAGLSVSKDNVLKFSAISVANGSTLRQGTDVQTSAHNYSLNLEAAVLNLPSLAAIRADAAGYTSSGLGEGGDGSSFDDYNTGGGGAYGGNGGAGKQGTINGSGGTAYGSLAQPTDLGSDGGEAIKARYSEVSNGGAGGGALFLNITGNLTVNGTISSNGAVGQAGQYLPAGGGSGGSIWIIARDWQGSGAIQANGGAGPTNTANWSGPRYGGGGSGGRVNVLYFSKTYTGNSGNSVASGGTSSGNSGSAGTVSQSALAFPASGVFVSRVLDAGQEVKFSKISWSSDVPAGTSVKFQAAFSHNDSSGFTAFVGPDGTSNSHYTSSGETLSLPSGTLEETFRYIKYKAVIESDSTKKFTPILKDVSFSYTAWPGLESSLVKKFFQDADFSGGLPASISVSDGRLKLQLNPLDSIAVKSAVLPSARYALACAENSSSNKIYCFGGFTSGGYSNQILEYDPAGNTIAVKSAVLPSGRAYLACAENSSSNKIYCFGGYDSSSGPYNQILEYDPARDTTVIKSAVLPSGRYNLACAENSSSHKIYCFGGDANSGLSNQILEYDPAGNTIAVKSAVLPSRRAYPACAENSSANKIYCFGGYTSGGHSNQILEYDPAGNTIAVKSAVLPSGRYNLACAENSSAHKIYCFGGDTDGGLSNQILEYDPAGNTIAVKSAVLPSARYALACAENSSAHKIYCFGGDNYTSGRSNQILEYSSSGYVSEGNFTSKIFDAGRNVDFTALNFNSSGAEVKFQIRSAKTQAELPLASWQGPAGPDSFYTSSGAAISSAHNNSQYIQYKAVLSTADTAQTPVLNDVTIYYQYKP